MSETDNTINQTVDPGVLVICSPGCYWQDSRTGVTYIGATVKQPSGSVPFRVPTRIYERDQRLNASRPMFRSVQE